MKRPLSAALVFFIAGITAGQYGNDLSIVLFFVSIFLCAAVVYLKHGRLFAVVFILAALAGTVRFYVSERYLRADSPAGKVAMAGIVRSTALTGTGRVKAVINARIIEDNGAAYGESFNVQAVFPQGVTVKAGETLEFTGELQTPAGPRNLGGYDEYGYLAARKIKYKTFAELDNITGSYRGLTAVLSGAGSALAAVYDEVLPVREAEIIKSIIIGDKSGLDNYTRDLFRLAGIYHILAISGLHVSVIALILNKLLRAAVPARVASLCVMAFLLLYCILTGASPSAVRAVIMSGIIIAGGLLRRPVDLITSTSFACLCILLYEPYFLWDTGFLYSFGAVFGIGFLSGPFKRIFAGFRVKEGYLSDTVISSVSVFLSTLPVAANTAYYLPVYSIVVNLLILPTVFFLVLMGFITGLAGLVSLNFAAFCAGSVFFTLRIYTGICEFFTSLPCSTLLIGNMNAVVVLSYYAVVFFFIKTFTSFESNFKRYAKYLCFTAVLFAGTFAYSRLGPYKLTVHMLDVGEGDAIVIMKGAYCVIIDGGGNLKQELGENTGTRVLIPFLNYHAVKTADAVFISHMDFDHAAGIWELIAENRADAVFIRHQAVDGLSKLDIAGLCGDKNVPLAGFSEGDIMTFDDVRIECLYPPRSINGLSENNMSMLLKLTGGGVAFLFTGDMEAEAEAYVLKEGTDISADILKLAHHGSKTSTTEAFLSRVNPSAAICSAAGGTHPAKVIMDRLEKFHIKTYNTYENGALILTASGSTIDIRGVLWYEKPKK